MIKIERSIDRVQSEYALVALAAIEDFHLKKLERNVEVGHRFQRTGDRRLQEYPARPEEK